MSQPKTPPKERFKVPTRIADKEWMIRQCLASPGVRKKLPELLEPVLAGAARQKICRRTAPRKVPDKEWMIRNCLTKAARENLYEMVAPLLDKATRERIGLRLKLPFYPQDPAVAEKHRELRPEAMPLADPALSVDWEPGLTDGPTSARLAVVDYNADTGTLTEPARWSSKLWAFTEPDGAAIPPQAPHSSYFHQVNLWFTVQTVLDFFEDPWALGRPVPWAFAGNRLILVPHAGWGANAFYDRHSKSLQLGYYGDPDRPGYTCLSHDIIAHETGHAVLDGIRPLYLEHSSLETAAFHEFVADLAALLTALRNNVGRAILAERQEELEGRVSLDGFVAEMATELGLYLKGRRYLRSAVNDRTMADLQPYHSPHHCSQVLTGAMYDILHGITRKQLEEEDTERKRPSYAQALWWATDRFRRIALQALDYCPPADVRFADYARAVLRCYSLASRGDSHGYGELMREVFHARGLCPRPWEECREGGEGCALDSEPAPDGLLLRHDIDTIAASRTGAYHFLHDNRRALKIPSHEDVEVTDLYRTDKWDVGRGRLPREVVLEYVWREPVALDRPHHGALAGRRASLLCGGTLVFDERGNVVSWARKPGSREDRGERAAELRRHLVELVGQGAVALMDAGEAGALGLQGPPVVARQTAAGLSFEAAPQMRDRGWEPAAAGEGGDEPEVADDSWRTEPWTTSF